MQKKHKKRITITSSVYRGNSNDNVKPDKDGYYRLVLGAFNIHNSAGQYWSFDGVTKLLNDKNSRFNKLITEGYLRAEMDHPKKEAHMSVNQYIQRLKTLELDRQVASIKSIELVELDERDSGANENIMLLYGMVKPTGIMSQPLKEALEDPSMNVAFSLRSLKVTKVVGGKFINYVTEIITWDYVPRPGINMANKWNSAGLESDDLLVIDIDDNADIDLAMNDIRSSFGEFGLESDIKAEECICSIKDACEYLDKNTDIVNKW